MRFWPRNKVAEELRITNSYLALIAEVMQKPESGFRPDGWYLSQIASAVRNRPTPKVSFSLGNSEQPLADAMELLARKLWIELPDESKEDLQP